MDIPRDPGQGPANGLPVDSPNPSVPTNTGIAPPTQAAPEPVDVPQLQDGFTSEQLPSQSPILRGDGPPVMKPVTDLVPNLQRMNDLGEIPARFASDMVLQKQQLASPGIPPEQVNQRVFEFFVQYASRFVEIAQPPVKKDGHLDHGDEDGNADRVVKKGKGDALPGDGDGPWEGEAGTPGQGKRPTRTGDVPVFNKEFGDKDFEEASYPGIGKGNLFQVIEQEESPRALREYTPHERESAIKEFATVLRDAGFEELKDTRTGKDGVTIAQELLRAKSPEEVDKRAQFIELQREVSPEQKMSKGAITLELPLEPIRELGQSSQASPVNDSTRRAVDAAYGGKSSAIAIDGLPPPRVTLEMRGVDESRPEPRATSRKKLGARMLWNVLHVFRKSGEDSAEEEAKWERFTTGAILLLVLVMIGAIVLVNL